MFASCLHIFPNQQHPPNTGSTKFQRYPDDIIWHLNQWGHHLFGHHILAERAVLTGPPIQFCTFDCEEKQKQQITSLSSCPKILCKSLLRLAPRWRAQPILKSSSRHVCFKFMSSELKSRIHTKMFSVTYRNHNKHNAPGFPKQSATVRLNLHTKQQRTGNTSRRISLLPPVLAKGIWGDCHSVPSLSLLNQTCGWAVICQHRPLATYGFKQVLRPAWMFLCSSSLKNINVLIVSS